MLIYKHLGVRPEEMPYQGMWGYVWVLEGSEPEAVMELVKEIMTLSTVIRYSASVRTVFDGYCRELQRWLLHDGWMLHDNQRLFRLSPGAEESSGIRDALIDQ